MLKLNNILQTHSDCQPGTYTEDHGRRISLNKTVAAGWIDGPPRTSESVLDLNDAPVRSACGNSSNKLEPALDVYMALVKPGLYLAY